MTWTPRRRFWRAATPRPEGEGFTVALDDRVLRTPAGAPLEVPTAPLAAAIADEWNQIKAEIEPDLLPITRLANSAIDRVEPQRDAVVDVIAEYGATDLVCYRVADPRGLAARQAAGWDPWLRWAERTLAASLRTVAGVMHQAQPLASLAALRAAVAAEDRFGLVALHELVALSGSLILGLAVRRGALDPAEGWDLSRIDETWQAEHWGFDSEAAAAAEAGCAAFHQAAVLSRLLDTSPPNRWANTQD